MTSQAIKKSTNPFRHIKTFEFKHFIFFLWGFFAGICIYKFEWPVPLQGTVSKVYASNELPEKWPINPEPRGSLVKIVCLVSPRLIKYMDPRQEVTFQTNVLGNIQKNKNLGTIVAIKRNPIQNQNEIRFIVECEINNSEISLSNGYQAKLIKGMKMNGHAYLNLKKIIEFLLDQLDQWLCPSLLRGT